MKRGAMRHETGAQLVIDVGQSKSMSGSDKWTSPISEEDLLPTHWCRELFGPSLRVLRALAVYLLGSPKARTSQIRITAKARKTRRGNGIRDISDGPVAHFGPNELDRSAEFAEPSSNE
jgi:hypothetical protein